MPNLTLLTWNLQGGSTAKESILPHVFNSDGLNYDVMCLQEVGPLPKLETNQHLLPKEDNDLHFWLYKYGAKGGWRIVHLKFGVSDDGSRCSTAIAIHLDEQEFAKALAKPDSLPQFQVFEPKDDDHYQVRRRILCVKHPHAPKLSICCVHAPASDNAFEYLKYMYGKMNLELGQWIAAGDHNIDPTEAPTGGKGDRAWLSTGPSAPTFNARKTLEKKIDYVTHTANVKCQASGVANKSMLSDHLPAMFTVAMPDH
jgi:endonuclease/exonuclease/phosphatase family metal-dependent hydrolase